MFRMFANVVDPFRPYAETVPPRSVLAYVLNTLAPFRLVLAAGTATSVFGAVIDVWLVYYAGRLVDSLTAISPAELWSRIGGELLFAAFVLLIVRPLNTAAGEAIDDIAFRPNAVSMMRWRAHRHLLRQSVGWFRNEPSGRPGQQGARTGDRRNRHHLPHGPHRGLCRRLYRRARSS